MITEAKRTNEVVSCQWHVIKARLVAPFACPAPAHGQNRAVLTGIVRDLGGVPIANVRLTVVDPRRVTVTTEDGKFTMPKLPSGNTRRLSVGRIGYRPTQLARVLVPGSNERSVDLEPIAHQLDAIRTSVEQTGVFGVVGDTAYEVVVGARVHLTEGVLGARVANELGQFAIDTVKPGANLLEVQKERFKPRLVSFTQPAGGGGTQSGEAPTRQRGRGASRLCTSL
ncbi:MAG: carboxypeptidase-like regulatory domain-containing protein [Gemmatimonadota bacterium]|nr:carboxypeptidase-like regulatory domain-containing protein [Gemmatimonadota bacterium]